MIHCQHFDIGTIRSRKSGKGEGSDTWKDFWQVTHASQFREKLTKIGKCGISRRTVVLLAKLGKQAKRPTVGTTGTVYYSLNNSYSCE